MDNNKYIHRSYNLSGKVIEKYNEEFERSRKMLKLDTKLLYACKSKELNSRFVKSKTTVKEFLSNLNYNDDTKEKIEKFLNTLTSDEYTEVPEEIREQHDYQNFVVYVKLDDEEN
jgi:hypothetical protein